MPRYHFHIDAEDLLIDTDGSNLPDDRAARREAGRLSRDALETLDALRADRPWRMCVVDEAGRTVLKIELTSGESPRRRITA